MISVITLLLHPEEASYKLGSYQVTTPPAIHSEYTALSMKDNINEAMWMCVWYVCVYMYACMSVYVCMCVCMYVCMYVCIMYYVLCMYYVCVPP